MEKSYNFSSIKFSELQGIVSFSLGDNEQKFEEWFNFSYNVSENEILFLENLIKKHKRRLPSYSEEKLKMRFLALILDKVDFSTDFFQDWYDSEISGTVNGVELKGYTDMMIAKGFYEPEKPYFFIQEFKPSKPNKDPEVQLLAEMLVAIEKNQKNLIYGSYIIGQNWKFVILEKIGENNFEYFVSEQLDSLKLPDLKQIYINLQAVKLKYCQD